ncbi:MAG: TetR/AcrR family transcriptional regulator [Bacteroidales bacterium]|jgi:AcrR family transcriptional regulator|nr:TetR/AcrR family transcriptional regulator [Bacteroidales bacterium]
MDEKFLQILKNALQVYIKFGIKSVSMDDMCKELKISKKTLYKYVANKEDLLKWIFVDYLSIQFNEYLTEKFVSQKKNAIDYFFVALEYLQQYNMVTPLMFNDLRLHYSGIFERLQEKQNAQRFAVLEQNLHQGQAEGLYRTNINSPLVLFIFTNSFIKDFPEECLFDKKELFDEVLRIYMCAIATPKGLEYYERLEHTVLIQ